MELTLINLVTFRCCMICKAGMGPFEKVNFHITGRGDDVVSKLITGGGKRSTNFSDCVTVNIVTNGVEQDVFDKMKIEEANEVGGILFNLISKPVSIFYRFGGFPMCPLTGFMKASE